MKGLVTRKRPLVNSWVLHLYVLFGGVWPQSGIFKEFWKN